MKSFKTKTIAVTLALFSTISANAENRVGGTLDYNTLINMDESIVSEAQKLLEDDKEKAHRYRAIEQIGVSVGAQHGYAARMSELEEKFLSISSYLDQMIDFRAVMLAATDSEEELFLLPPVVTETKGMSALSEDGETLRLTGTTFNILKPERLVLAAPTWRQYLIATPEIEVKNPHPTMLPKNSKEKAIWAEAVKRGWQAGSTQADHEMNDRIEQMGLDFLGMLRYMRLVAEGKVSKPIIAKTHQNVIGGGSEMRLNDTTYRLTSESSLLSNVKLWKPLLLDTRDGLRYDVEFE